VSPNTVARRKARRLGGHDFGNAAAGHHRVGLDRSAISRPMHPCPVGGVERNIAHPQQSLAIPGLGDSALGHFEMLGPKFSGRLFNEQDLAIDTVTHGISLRLMWLFLMQPARKKCAAAHIVHCIRR
jgi:hypothetical protein